MTILEMLDQIEAEIASLRARNRELETAGPSALSPKPRKVAARKKKAGKKPRAPRHKPEQLTLPSPEPAPPDQKPAAGKRLALGKSLLDLRKASFARAQAALERTARAKQPE